MQANCPSCSYKIVIDDARVPERAFSVKCPKCQSTVKFPGKGAGGAGPDAASSNADEMRAQMMAQIRREMALGGGEGAHAGERALVALADRSQAGNIALTLTRLGYSVESLNDSEEGGRLLEQGVYQVVVTSAAAAPGGRETLYQRATRIGPEARRRIFMVLIGDAFKTGDGTQAFVLQADLVVSSQDAATADTVFRNTLAERARVYQAFNEARKRADAAAGY